MYLDEKDQKSLIRNLPEDLQWSEGDFISEQDLLAALARKVEYMLHYNNGVFFQLLYKMDVLEPKLRVAMQQVDVPMSIAKLILERQLEKLASRKANPAKPAEEDDLVW